MKRALRIAAVALALPPAATLSAWAALGWAMTAGAYSIILGIAALGLSMLAGEE